jgi:hypothetical protein
VRDCSPPAFVQTQQRCGEPARTHYDQHMSAVRKTQMGFALRDTNVHRLAALEGD